LSRQVPRKRPTQARSIATYNRIVDAAGRVLLTSGYEQASTHRIAEAAGVSPGSVYQYFPNKDAIVQEAVDRLVASQGESLSRLVAGRMMSGHASMKSVVEATLASAEGHRELTRFVMTELPHLGGSAIVTRTQGRARELIRAYLAAQSKRPMHDELSSARVWVAAVVLQQTVFRFVTEAPSLDREAFVDATVLALEALLTSTTGGA
jgi:AcrR family transcriptional regulator